MAQRIKGQEVSITIVADSQPLTTITDVRSFEMSWQLEVLKEGYLGETSDRRDSIFRGIKGKLDLHIENADIFNLIQALLDKAQRRTPGVVINIKATLAFPNGNRPKVVVQDAEFGELPLSFGSRADYGTVSLDFEAQQALIA